MNPETGAVASHTTCTSEEWGGETFEDAALLEVVENVEGQEDYDLEYGDWRPAGDEDLSANSTSDDLDQWDPEACPECQGKISTCLIRIFGQHLTLTTTLPM